MASLLILAGCAAVPWEPLEAQATGFALSNCWWDRKDAPSPFRGRHSDDAPVIVEHLKAAR
ncbi:hypothetical protein [uncultured Paludibaculum sp.]|uniref:hypothetical protein n=1 Tax=uncultured Paludibaculum sp. TaxID=1765020 RepID=UPI002AAC1BC7|nr:hypothetical protein [uncultured Paludibaculum sp.]